VVLRKGMSSVQCVLAAGAGGSAQMVAFAKSLTRESVVDIEGAVSFPKEPLVSTTQQVQHGHRHPKRTAKKLFCRQIKFEVGQPRRGRQEAKWHARPGGDGSDAAPYIIDIV